MSENRQKSYLTAAEQREMEPQEIREGYLVKKVRDQTLLIKSCPPLLQARVGFGHTCCDGAEAVGYTLQKTLGHMFATIAAEFVVCWSDNTQPAAPVAAAWRFNGLPIT